MSACQEVGRWVTENIVVPVDRFFERAREVCSEIRRWVEREVRKPIETWRTQEERRCRRRECNWWCLCCNKWFCWLVTVLVKIIEWIIEVVGEWLVETVCEIVVEVVRIVVNTIIRVVKWVVDFVVCLFTDPLSALESITDLWWVIVDVVDDALDLVTEILDDVNELLEITEDFIEDLGSSFGPLGKFISFIFKWVATVAEGIISVVRDVVETVQDVVVGILRLNPCRIAEAGADLGTAIVGVITVIGRVLGGGYIGAGRDVIEQEFVEDVVDAAISNTFKDPDTLEQVRDRIQLGTTRFGLPVEPDLRRMCISSREKNVSLRTMHNSGTLNLFQAAGYVSGCDNGVYNRPRMEVVYAGTGIRVTTRDLRTYLNGNPNDVAEFEVYAITKSVYLDYYKLAQRKARSLGLRFANVPINTYRVTQVDEIPVNDNDQEFLFLRMGRTATNDNLCKPPVIAVFRYATASLNGLTTWFRPPNAVQASGVTFRDRLPAYLFRWVMVHELGHYFGLDHTGHNGAHLIMYTAAPSQGLNPVTGGTVAELIFFTGEPRFNVEDARNTWAWLTQNAQACLRG